MFLLFQPACQTEGFILFYSITKVMGTSVKNGYCGPLRFMTLTLTVVSQREVGTLDLYDTQIDVLHLQTNGAEEWLCIVRVN
jgi:hypothetical protein